MQNKRLPQQLQSVVHRNNCLFVSFLMRFFFRHLMAGHLFFIFNQPGVFMFTFTQCYWRFFHHVSERLIYLMRRKYHVIYHKNQRPCTT